MPTIGSLTTFTPATTAQSSQVNSNFSTIRTAVNAYCAFIDTSCTITGAWTFSTAPTIAGAMAFGSTVTVASGVTVTAGGVTVTAGGLTVTGNSTITGTLGGLTGLTVASGGITVTAGASSFGADVTVTGTVTATTFSGSGASLTNIPAANLTGTIGAVSGANLTNLNGSNIASGTVAAARVASSFPGLTFTGEIDVDNDVSIDFTGTAGAANAFKFESSYWTADVPTATTTRYLRVTVGGTAYRIKLESVA